VGVYVLLRPEGIRGQLVLLDIRVAAIDLYPVEIWIICRLVDLGISDRGTGDAGSQVRGEPMPETRGL
jgi:hypothetical protein